MAWAFENWCFELQLWLGVLELVFKLQLWLGVSKIGVLNCNCGLVFSNRCVKL